MSATTAAPLMDAHQRARDEWRLESEYRDAHSDEVAADLVRQARKRKLDHSAYCLEHGFDSEAPTPDGAWADAILQADGVAAVLSVLEYGHYHWERSLEPLEDAPASAEEPASHVLNAATIAVEADGISVSMPPSWLQNLPLAEQDRIAALERTRLSNLNATNEAAINLEVNHIKIRTEAERRVQAEIYDGLGGPVSFEELRSRATMEFLVPDLLAAGSLALLVGKRNLGKSLLADSLAFSIATGTEFLGLPVSQGRVYFVLGEGGGGLTHRLDAWAQANDIPSKEVEVMCAIYERGNLSNDTSFDDIRRQVADFQPTLIILDTYSSLSGVQDEDKAALNAEVINRIKMLAPGATKLILHHPTKSTEDSEAPIARGSGTLTANVDTVFSLYRDKHHVVPNMSGETWLALSTEEDHQGKQREGKRITLTGLHVVPQGKSAIIEQHSGETFSRADAWVAANVGIGETVTVPELVEKTKASRNTVRGHLRNSRLTSIQPERVTGAEAYSRTA